MLIEKPKEKHVTEKGVEQKIRKSWLGV